MNQMPQGMMEPPAQRVLTCEEENEAIENFYSDCIKSMTFNKDRMVAPRLETEFKMCREYFKSRFATILASKSEGCTDRSLSLVEKTQCCKENGTCDEPAANA